LTTSKKKYYIILTVHIGWLLLTVIKLSLYLPKTSIEKSLLELISIQSFFYANYYIGFPWVMKKGFDLYKLSASFLLFAICYYTFFATLGSHFAFHVSYDIRARLFYGINLSMFDSILYFWSASSAARLWEHWLTNRSIMKKLELEQHLLSYQILKSKMNPALIENYVDFLISKNEKEVISDDVIKLSDLLRHQLYESNKEFVLIENEVEFLKLYLDLIEKSSNWDINFISAIKEDIKIKPLQLFIITEPIIFLVKEKGSINIKLSSTDVNSCQLTIIVSDISLTPLKKELELLEASWKHKKNKTILTFNIDAL